MKKIAAMVLAGVLAAVPVSTAGAAEFQEDVYKRQLHTFFQIFTGLHCCLCVRHIKCILMDFFFIKRSNFNRSDRSGIGAD